MFYIIVVYGICIIGFIRNKNRVKLINEIKRNII